MNYTLISLYLMLLFSTTNHNLKGSEKPLSSIIISDVSDVVDSCKYYANTFYYKIFSPDSFALYNACKDRNINLIKTLLNDHGMDPNAALTCRDGAGSLIIDSPLYVALKEDYTDVMSILIPYLKKKGVSKNAYHGDFNFKIRYDTPLHFAITCNDIEGVKSFLAQQSISEKLSDYFVLYACSNGRVEIIDLLLNDVRINKPNKDSIAEALIRGIFINRISAAIFEQISQKVEININRNFPAGNTLLRAACTCENKELIRVLLAKGADILMKDVVGLTDFYCAFTQGQEIAKIIIDTIPEQQRSDVFFKILDSYSLDYGTPYSGEKQYLDWCVKNGANFNLRNQKSVRVVDNAEKRYFCSIKENESASHEEKAYHSFLLKTPYCSDAELYWYLRDNIPHDVFKKIMGYYKAVTIEREIACHRTINCFYSYEKSRPEKADFRKNLLAEVCTKYGYHNPNVLEIAY